MIFQLLLKIVSGVCSDHISFISEKCKLRIFNSLAQYGCAVLLVLLAFSPPNDIRIHVTLAILPLGMLGFAAGGCSKSAVLVARQYSPTVMGFVQVCIPTCYWYSIVVFIAENTVYLRNNLEKRCRLVDSPLSTLSLASFQDERKLSKHQIRLPMLLWLF